jgi:hypothetical protein
MRRFVGVRRRALRCLRGLRGSLLGVCVARRVLRLYCVGLLAHCREWGISGPQLRDKGEGRDEPECAMAFTSLIALMDAGRIMAKSTS